MRAGGFWLAAGAIAVLGAPWGVAASPDLSVRPPARPVVEAAGESRRAPDPARLTATVLALRAMAQGAVALPSPDQEAAPHAAAEPAPVFAHPDPGFADAAFPPPRAADAGWIEAGALPRPRLRPETAGQAVQAVVARPDLASRIIAALRPEPRPRAPFAAPREPAVTEPAAAIRPAPGTGPLASRRGSVCGLPGLKGEPLAPIVGRVRGCGVASPVRITSVDGVRLSRGAVMDCDTARALQRWVQTGVQPAFGGQVVQLQVAGHYVCRTRNHRKGARLSEHAKGKAIDIAGLVLANGTTLSIRGDWRGRHGKALKAAHRAACGVFGTTLGPGSDGMHEDHLHLDTARHRNGPYCR